MREKDFPVEVVELKGSYPFLVLLPFTLTTHSQTLSPNSHGSPREIGLRLFPVVILTWEILAPVLLSRRTSAFINLITQKMISDFSVSSFTSF